MVKFAAVALSAALLAGSASAAIPLNQGIANAKHAAAHEMHKAHLELALKDILTAEVDAKKGNIKAAEKAAAAAMHQIGQAQAHHKTNSQLHATHHTHLQSAMADLRKAETQLKSGKIGTAEHDLAKAAQQVRESLGHHHKGTMKTKAKTNSKAKVNKK